MDKSCPGALPDFRNPGLYFSYDACQDDQSVLSRCQWKDEVGSASTCLNETLIRSSMPSVQTAFTFSTVMSNGIATFTDLSSVSCGHYNLMVQVNLLSGPLIWKYSGTIGVRPAYSRKMVIITAPNGGLPGFPLQSQPTVSLIDNFGNRVFNDKICTAVTASVASWAGKTTSSIGLQSPRRYVYGQQPGDNNLYPYGCSTDPNLMCR